MDEIETNYRACCGKRICAGCTHADKTENNRTICPFCRTPAPTSEGEAIESLKERAGGGDAIAIFQLGCYYERGVYGLPQNYDKAMELYLRAGELGYAVGYFNLGAAFDRGEGVRRDDKKAQYYYELAAIGGDVTARYNLGALEKNAGNMNRAVKHWMIAAGAGYDDSLKQIRECFVNGYATKDDFEKALRAHKHAKDEMKSDQRDSATAARRGL